MQSEHVVFFYYKKAHAVRLLKKLTFKIEKELEEAKKGKAFVNSKIM
jgi:hypothetical protein